MGPSYTGVRVDAARHERAVRAYHLRELRKRPKESEPHAWAAYDILRALLDRAQMALPLPGPNSTSPVSEYSRQRQVFEERQLEWEKWIARKYPREAARAIEHAEKALRFAADPRQEMQARRILGDAYRFAGRYDAAIRQFAWLSSVEPHGDRGMLLRCFAHKGLRVRWENRDGNYWAHVGGRSWPIGMRSAGPFIESTRQWLKRWPDSSFLHARLGGFYYTRALEEATQQPDFPKPGPEFGKRVDACIWRHARRWVEAGMRQFEQALSLADRPGDRARALTELGHGYLIRADYDAAIPLLKEALDLEPWNRSAQDYLRQAYRRRGRGQDRIVTTARPFGTWFAEGYGMPPLNTSYPGYGFGFPRLSRAEADEARELLRILRPARPPFVGATADPHRAQAARNRLDELLPGSGIRYRKATGDVLAVDVAQASARLERLETLGIISPR